MPGMQTIGAVGPETAREQTKFGGQRKLASQLGTQMSGTALKGSATGRQISPEGQFVPVVRQPACKQ